MKIFDTFFSIILILAYQVVLLASGYFLIKYAINLIGLPELLVATLAALAAVVAFLGGAILAAVWQARRQKENGSGVQFEKAKLYQQLLALWSEFLKNNAYGSDWVADSELLRREQKLALLGSPTVIATYGTLRRSAPLPDADPGNLSRLLYTLILEMRRDLGLAVTGLQENDLLGLLLDR